MASKEDIQNRALLLIGTEEISDFTNDSDRKIATLNHFYEELKNKLLNSWGLHPCIMLVLKIII